MLTLLFDTSFWYDIALVIVIAAIIIACIKYPNGKIYIASIVMILLIGASVYCGIQLNFYYTSEGGIWGKIYGLITNNTITVTVDDSIKIDVQNLVLTNEKDDIYSAIIYSDEVLKLDNDKKYTVLVNNEDISINAIESGYINASFRYNFFDNNLQTLCDDTLYMNFAFYNNSTYLKLYTEGGQNAVNYWNKFIANNNFTIEIKESEYIKDNEMEVIDSDSLDQGEFTKHFKQVSYYIDDEYYTSQFYYPGTEIDLLNYTPSQNNLTLLAWYDEDDNKIKDGTAVNDSLNLYGYCVELIEDFEIKDGVINDYTGSDSTVVIPSTYSTFDGYVFEGNDLTVNSVAFGAFSNCSFIISLTIPSSIINVYDRAFGGCYNLSSLIIDSKEVYNIISNTHDSHIANYATDIYILSSIDDKTNSYLSSTDNFEFSTTVINSKQYNHYKKLVNSTVTVTFYSYNDNLEMEVYSSQEYKVGQTINFPEDPPRLEGMVHNVTTGSTYWVFYYFNSWRDSNDKVIGDDFIVRDDLELYAYYVDDGGTPPPAIEM